ncbi:hypothetical protein Cus16_1041 [Curtobacterium sp. ER1/6]|nr:hypothetical protein Cus16_1041 [Curtobacterium sp. ER1/6]
MDRDVARLLGEVLVGADDVRAQVHGGVSGRIPPGVGGCRRELRPLAGEIAADRFEVCFGLGVVAAGQELRDPPLLVDDVRDEVAGRPLRVRSGCIPVGHGDDAAAELLGGERLQCDPVGGHGGAPLRRDGCRVQLPSRTGDSRARARAGRHATPARGRGGAGLAVVGDGRRLGVSASRRLGVRASGSGGAERAPGERAGGPCAFARVRGARSARSACDDDPARAGRPRS